MLQPDHRSKNNDKFYVLDLSYRAKARVLAEATVAGGAAAVMAKIAFGLFLPEAIAVVLCAPAFAEAADYTTTRFNKKINPQDLVLREMRKPRFDI